jgi:ATP-binding protein involved in chromosome partitioning
MPSKEEIEAMKKRSSEAMKSKTGEIKHRLAGIKHKIAVYSCKGGVGKTTIAVNLAVSLADRGYSVGFLDADIDCPNAHIVLGIKEKIVAEDGIFVPVEKYGVKFISMANLTDDNNAIMWRGPIVTKAISDFLMFSEWGDLDYLVIDLPPGTSDVPITIMQLIDDMDGFVVVTTPQILSGADTARSIDMIKNMNRKVVGVVENMCGDVFGCSHNKNYLAHIPLKKEIPENCGSGKPSVIGDEEVRRIFDDIINKIITIC